MTPFMISKAARGDTPVSDPPLCVTSPLAAQILERIQNTFNDMSKLSGMGGTENFVEPLLALWGSWAAL